MRNVINWFEIPVTNFEQAKKFYETIFDVEMNTIEAMGMKSSFFPANLESGEVGGCIVKGEGYVPSPLGTLVYLNGGKDLDTVLSKVEGAGGKIILPKIAIGHNGFMAHFEDTEGNRIGVHSMQ